jgi:hypothetical protein
MILKTTGDELVISTTTVLPVILHETAHETWASTDVLIKIITYCPKESIFYGSFRGRDVHLPKKKQIISTLLRQKYDH